jgi:RNA polymerase sigma-70 factor (ECF subfamily)
VLRLQDGDMQALDLLIRQTEELGKGLAWARLRNQQAAEDVLQDAYVIVYREIRRLRDPSAFKGWFCRIVINLCRQVQRRPLAASLDQAREDGLEPAVSGEGTDVLRRLDVRRALEMLPEADRTLLVLREVNSLSYQEIATTLGVPVGTVKSRLSEARRRLLAAWTGPTSPQTPDKVKRRGRPSKLPFASHFVALLWGKETLHVQVV